jgi:phospholipase C
MAQVPGKAAIIDHVIVLMLENRSFDSMLGRLYPNGPGFDGVPEGASNRVGDTDYPTWTSAADDPNSYFIPTPDPNEKFANMTTQIYGAGPPPALPDMSGFARDYASVPGADPRSVMHGYTDQQLPVLSTLAKSFAVSDRWFASAPNQTWPNRFFVHTGTANGYVNNSPIHVPYMMETIFNRLSDNNRSWRIYYHDVPQTLTLSRIWGSLPEHLFPFESSFMADAMAGRLPNYSFIEPRYFADPLVNRLPNDQHPPHDVALGERLIARIFDAVRNGAGWERSLFIITFDEHGGLWDHVPPPAAAPPGPPYGDGFKFDRYGVRVPAILISPWIEAGTVLRPPAGSFPFDHTSIIASLNALFGPFKPLTMRDKAAPTVFDCLNLATPSNAGPRSIPLPAPIASAPQFDLALDKAATEAQKALAAVANALPAGTAAIAEHLEALRKAPMVTGAIEQSASEAFSMAKQGLQRFLHGGTVA